VSGIARSTVRYQPRGKTDEKELQATLQTYAQRYPQHGYRHITARMQRDGYAVNHKRIERLWRAAGLQHPRRRTTKRRQEVSEEGLKRAEYLNHLWSYDFTQDQTERGQRIRILAVLDEFSRECLLLLAARSFCAAQVVSVLQWLFATRAVPEHIRSDNGPEFIATAVKDWLQVNGSHTLYIEPGHPWQNPFIERFFGTLKSECLDRYLFDTLPAAQRLLDHWLIEYNQHRPHSALDYFTPLEFHLAHSIPLTLSGS
jgi:transposase InsO family protein